MDAADAIAAWRDFYGAVANAAAALLGLVFVGLSLHLSLRRATAPVRSLAMASAITLLQPLLVALVMLIPFGAPGLHGAGLVVLGIVVAVELAAVFRMRIAARSDSVFWLAYRSGIPLIASAVLIAGGIGLLTGSSVAIYAPAVFVFSMAVVGVQDAFDLLMGRRGTRARADGSGVARRFAEGAPGTRHSPAGIPGQPL